MLAPVIANRCRDQITTDVDAARDRVQRAERDYEREVLLGRVEQSVRVILRQKAGDWQREQADEQALVALALPEVRGRQRQHRNAEQDEGKWDDQVERDLKLGWREARMRLGVPRPGTSPAVQQETGLNEDVTLRPKQVVSMRVVPRSAGPEKLAANG